MFPLPFFMIDFIHNSNNIIMVLKIPELFYLTHQETKFGIKLSLQAIPKQSLAWEFRIINHNAVIAHRVSQSFHSVFTLSFPDMKSGKYDLQISNVAGQIIHTSREMIPATVFERKLDLSEFPDGTYFVRLITASGTSVTRIVKGK